jgi:hypothetical protein
MVDCSTTKTIAENGPLTQEGHFTQLPYCQFQQFLVSVFLEKNENFRKAKCTEISAPA